MIAASGDPDKVADLARNALAEGREDQALPHVRDAAVRHGSARLWQWTGLLHRSLDEHGDALRAFETAAEFDPDDPTIAHGRAQVALEAGLDAVDFFEVARRLAPNNGEVLIGLAAARAARGEADQGANLLETVLEQAPGWLQGHTHLAQLRSTMGQGARATESLERAIANRAEPSLWRALLDVDVKREDYRRLAQTIGRARQGGLGAADLRIYSAIAASALSAELWPRALFQVASDNDDLAVWRIRHFIRIGRADMAAPLIDQQLATVRAADVWPYASIVWRLCGDPRSAWLEGDPRLVQTIDLSPLLADCNLAATLRRLHVAKSEYLGQSVRGGTQTDGPLFSRVDPPIRDLRAVVVGAVGRYLGTLPPKDRNHPLLAGRRDRRIRFAGSWSVRLLGQGHHANHVHPHGWISSALYVSLPDMAHNEGRHPGWLTLGAPEDRLNSGLEPTQRIEPRCARLVLFPSWMWHGTVPFASGERLTIAFDVARPL